MSGAGELAGQIARYGAAVREFFHAGERATLISPLFNVPARLVVGSYCYFEHAAAIIRHALDAAGAEEIGAHMRGLCVRPNYVNLNALMLGYLNGREQLRLRAGLGGGEALPAERLEDTATVVDAWRRIGAAYLGGPDLLPSETGRALRVLAADGVEAAAALTRPVGDADERTRARRMMAVAELYTFILNGEARVGVFNHGPYPLSGGEALVVKELVGLRDRFLPWELRTRPALDAVARIMRVRDLEIEVDLFASLLARPFEHEDRIVSEALVTVEDGAARPLGEREVAELTEAAGLAQVEMYEQAAGWSPEYAIGYGADLYALLIAAFPRVAGAPMDEEIRDAFRATAERVVPDLRSGADPPLVLGRLGAAEGELYSTALPAAGGGPVTLEQANAVILRFGESQKAAMRAERRETLRSVLFDLPRRSSLGWQALYEHEVPLLRELAARVPPEELGRRMRTLGGRPYVLQPFILMCSYLGARQQRMLDLGLREGDPFPEERIEDLVFLADFWSRLMAAYRTDGALLPDEAGGAQPVLDEAALAPVREALHPSGAEELRRVRRMAATLELYAFVLHGEQRDGIFGHGPYPGADGRVLFLKEFNDLRNSALPWAATRAENPFRAVSVAYECRDVAVRCDMFGGIVTDPLEVGERLARVAVIAHGGDGRARALDPDEATAVQEAAAAAQEELYLAAVDWSPRYKIEYGAYLFANHLTPFFALAGLGDEYGPRIVAACERTAGRMVDELLAGEEVPSVWRHMGTTEGAFFWPARP